MKLIIKIGVDFPLVPDMIAGGEHIDPDFKQFPGDIRGQTETGRCIFAIGDDQIDLVAIYQTIKFAYQSLAAGAANDISNK
jgi:hypothetical protein